MDQSKARARRCAIYTRKSSEEVAPSLRTGLQLLLQAQREACEAFIKSFRAKRGPRRNSS